jgi:hypothetical protein
LRLLICRVDANAGGVEHVLDIARLRLRKQAPYIPALKDGVLRPKKITVAK